MKKRKVAASIAVVGSLIAQGTMPIYATNIQNINPYNEKTAISLEKATSLGAKVVGIDGYVGQIILPEGELNSETIKSPVNDYDFSCVKVGNTVINYVGIYTNEQGEELWYYSTDGINATIFDETTIDQITIEFVKHVDTYHIQYEHDDTVSIDGPQTVTEGHDLSFTIHMLNNEYEIKQVLVNEKDYTSQLNKNTLTVSKDEIHKDLNIKIITQQATEFDVIYDDNFLMNGTVDGEHGGCR